MTEKDLQALKQDVKQAAAIAMIGLIEGEAHNPKGMELPEVARAANQMGLELVLHFNSKAFQTELANRLAEL